MTNAPTSPARPTSGPHGRAPESIPRRGFLVKAAAAVIGAVITIVPLVVSLVFFLDPLWRRRRAEPGADSGTGFVPVTRTDNVGPVPTKFPVVMDRRDAWNFFPQQRVGNVILRKVSDGPIRSAEDVVAFTDVCPHLGCTVEHKVVETNGEKESRFVCPCHASSFKLDGEKVNRIPPRGLDPLPVEIRNGNEVWINYQRFEAGIHERRVI